MNSSDLSGLIGRLEREADEYPRYYLGKLLLVAALGYALPALLALGILLSSLYIAYAVVTVGTPPIWLVLIAVGCVVALLATVRALHVQVAEPDDPQVTRDEAPQLFALIDMVCARMLAPPLAAVSIHAEFCINILQRPRRGVFGGQRNHLQLGVPLLLALGTEELTAVLAHEVGHISRLRRLDAWIYQQRPAWNLLGRKLAQPASSYERVLARFYGRYALWFHAYSLPLARRHELEADNIAAAITSPQTLGRALIKQELIGRFLSAVFWPRFLAQVEKSPEPPQRPYSLLPRALRLAQQEWLRPQWLTAALARYATADDTHPAFAERLAALEVTAQLPAFAAESTALTLLGALAPRLINHCDEVWLAQNAAGWRARHDEIKEARWKIAEYEQYDGSTLDIQDLWAKAHLLLKVSREPEAIGSLQLLLARDTAYPQAHLLLGRLLLAQGDEQGLQHLIFAAEQDIEAASTAGSIGYDYLIERGRKGEAMRFEQRVGISIATG